MITTIIIAAVSCWVLIGFLTVLIYGWIYHLNVDFSALLLGIICGPFMIIVSTWCRMDEEHKLPKWMYKEILTHLK